MTTTSLCLSATLAAGGKKWVRIAYPGTFKGHAAGTFSLTAEVFGQVVRNFRERNLPVPIDVNHASEDPNQNWRVEVASSHGFTRALEVRNSELWGELEVYEPALSAVRSGKLPYLSPAIRFGARHPETGADIGARLTSVALCAQPFLARQKPLELSDSPRVVAPLASAPPRETLSLSQLAERLRREGYSNESACNLALRTFLNPDALNAAAPPPPPVETLSFAQLADRLRQEGYSNEKACNIAARAFMGLA